MTRRLCRGLCRRGKLSGRRLKKRKKKPRRNAKPLRKNKRKKAVIWGRALNVADGVAGVYDGVANNVVSGVQGKSYEFDPWDLAYALPLAGKALASGARALRAAVPFVDDAARAAGAGLKAAGEALKALPGVSKTMKFMSSSAAIACLCAMANLIRAIELPLNKLLKPLKSLVLIKTRLYFPWTTSF